MTVERYLMEALKTSPVYVEDVFSTYLYTGNGSTQTINNGIDLATKGGLVWIKGRSGATNHLLTDTTRGATKRLSSNLADANQSTDATGLTAFSTNGFSIGSGAAYNTNAATYVSWAFRKAAKFFTQITYSGNGAVRNISHDLGAVPGMIIIKSFSSAIGNEDWFVYHKSLGATKRLLLNATSAEAVNPDFMNNTAPTATQFTIGLEQDVNRTGSTYVAYLFADQAGGFGLSGSDSVVACGSWTTASGSGADFNVSLGWEPQYILIKRTDASSNWFVFDTMRGLFNVSANTGVGIEANPLYPNLSNAEAIRTNFVGVSANGFNAAFTGGGTFIYLAIRRGPMKTPTDATKVFSPVIWTGNDTTSRQISTGLLSPPDLSITQFTNGVQSNLWWDRLRGLSSTANGLSVFLRSPTTDAEGALAQYYTTPTMTAVGFGTTSSGSVQLNGSGASVVAWNCRRAPGFFDIVCYTGTGSATTQAHNLGVAPELMIFKSRNTATTNWAVCRPLTPTTYQYLVLQLSNLASTRDYGPGGSPNFEELSAPPTATVINLASSAELNFSGRAFVTYLFATCPGVSKVGSYTGTGAAQNINCGFSASARFVLIKRTNSTGGWYVYDSARGISSGSDPYLLWNSAAAEVTGTNYVDTFASGFALTATAPAELNANGGSYIFLAVA